MIGLNKETYKSDDEKVKKSGKRRVWSKLMIKSKSFENYWWTSLEKWARHLKAILNSDDPKQRSIVVWAC